MLAERGRFELPSPVKGCRFSRPVQSTALPPLRTGPAMLPDSRGGSPRFFLEIAGN
jgi:hypothetical protein